MEKLFTNKDRTRYYGVRVGDICKDAFDNKDRPLSPMMVIGYHPLNNNCVIVRNIEGGEKEPFSFVAEWLNIIDEFKDPSAETRSYAQAVHDHIKTHGWCQHKLREKDGRVCLRGAMDIVCVRIHPELGPMVNGYAGLAQTIYRVTGMHPIAYNDRPECTKEGVLSMLEYITHLS